MKYVFGDKLPLRSISEHISVVPEGGWDVVSVGWPKVLFFFDADLTVSLAGGLTHRLGSGDTLILTGDRQTKYFPGSSRGQTRMHVLAIFFDRPSYGLKGQNSVWDVEFLQYLKDTFRTDVLLRAKEHQRLWIEAVKLRRECEAHSHFREELACSAARQFVLHAAEEAGIQPGPKLEPAEQLVREAEAQFTTNGGLTSVAEIASSLKVSTKSLNASFLDNRGQPVARCVQDNVIEIAKLLLLESPAPILNVAKRVGFGSASAFCRAFRASTGVTPNAYLRAHSGTPLSASHLSAGQDLEKPRKRLPFGKENWRFKVCRGKFKTSCPALLICIEGQTAVLSPAKKRFDLSETDRAVLVVGAGCSMEFAAPAGSPAKVIYLESKSASPGAGVFRETAILLPWRANPSLDLVRFYFGLRKPSLHQRLWICSLSRTLWLKAMQTISMANFEATPPKRAHWLLMNHTKDFLSKHFRESLSLDAIAYAVGVSGEHLARTFRAESGKTVIQLLYETRISKAKEFLAKPRHSFEQVAEMSGFTSISHFYRIFKKQAGCTPATFRARVSAETRAKLPNKA